MSAKAPAKLLKQKDQPKLVQELIEAARAARENSYSPYSGHKVGAAIRLKSGRVFGGCNVENSSYGGTICAERSAIMSAVSQTGPVAITEVAVVTDSADPWPPCGLCRQVIAEFAGPEIPLYSANLQGELKQSKFGELFPDAFTPAFLKK